ncbi:FHA domain protein [Malaciobacter marinus]|jgi:type VI secretion system FHA domain protein|uniref:FHA domain protein n=1 Tax=Malaciobacter marinus TaxID=505249 RepID=A0AB36ZWC2_9BACT|nr:type VI secretion system-associated FHA domain protein [Malaciobacter marinus]PPK61319.1 FHA domain protein [Malaciobacter marinus]SKB66412.1 FHA domain protein [Malaciobacter marinus]
MKLILDIVKHPQEKLLKRNFQFNKIGGVVGRSNDIDNSLADSKNIISSKHFLIHFQDKQYFIEDISTNGTFLKNPFSKLLKNEPVKINDLDIFIVGEYELQARFTSLEYSNTQEKFNENKLIPDDFLIDEDLKSLSIEEDNHSSSVLDILKEDTTSNTIVETIYEEEHKVSKDILDDHIDVDTYIKDEKVENSFNKEIASVEDELQILGKNLGIEFDSLSKKERENVLNEISDIVINSLEGLKNSLFIKEKITKDLNIQENMKIKNPINMGLLALNVVDINDTEKVSLSEAVTKSFKELDTHNVALHRTSKNLINITTSKFSPKNLEYYFESNNEINSLLPKKSQLWNCYSKMLNKIDENPNHGQELIMNDFVNEYKNILYTIKLTSL